jgi:hypothetical protein
MKKTISSIVVAMLCLGMAGAATAATYSYTGGNLFIPDDANNDGVSANIDVGDIPGIVTDVNVFVDISHTSIGDLEIYLDHSFDGGTTWKSVQLFNHDFFYYPNFGFIYNSLDNMSNVLFDDQAAISISDPSVRAPYGPGSFQPTTDPYEGESNLLADFNDDLAAGIWRLYIYDWGPGDIGTLNNFYVEIASEDAPTSAVPLPGAVVLLGLGLGALVGVRRAA